jgi:phosphotransferase system IIB component
VIYAGNNTGFGQQDISLFQARAVHKYMSFVKTVYILNTIGGKANLELIPLWVDFCYTEFRLTVNDLDLLQNFSIELLKANKQKGFVNQQTLQNFIAGQWFNICFNKINDAGIRQLFFNSALSKAVPFSKRLKFRLKAILV